MLMMLEQAKRHFEAPGLRTDLVSSMNSFGAELVNYGCWCAFDDDHSLVGGDVQDHFDGACKALHQGYDCITADVGDTCSTPWSESFGVPNLFTGDMSDATLSLSECTARNAGNECKIKACQVEMNFISYVIKSIFQQPGVDHTPPADSLAHTNLDFENTCIKASTVIDVVAGGGGGVGGGVGGGDGGGVAVSSAVCCGTYPQRLPYNSVLMQCSADGTTLSAVGN